MPSNPVRKTGSGSRQATSGAVWYAGAIGQLHGIAPIPVGLPEDDIGVGHIQHELTVRRESDTLGRNTREIGLELVGPGIPADQFSTRDEARGKDRFPVLTGVGPAPADGAGRQLNRLGGCPPEHPAILIESPQLLRSLRVVICQRIVPYEKFKEIPIRSPTPAEQQRRRVPASQQRMKRSEEHTSETPV